MRRRIQTQLFGEIEIEQEKIITFEQGLPGFEQARGFVFLPLEDSMFTIMQSADSELHFVTLNPFMVFPDYDFDLSQSDMDYLGINREKDILVYNIVVIHQEFGKSTVNMQAPIVLNLGTNKGKQIVLNQYKMKQPLFPDGSHVTNR